MTLQRWRRIGTGLAAGIIVLCAALAGASLRSDNSVAVAEQSRVATAIPIPADAEIDEAEEAPSADSAADATEAADDASDATPSATVSEPESGEATSTTDDSAAESGTTTTESTETAADDSSPTESSTDTSDDAVRVIEEDAVEAEAAPSTNGDDSESAPLATDDVLGTGGGVDDAECALDRLIIYAGARRGGVASSLRNALVNAGFGADCSEPVAILASNCPLQFSGVLGADAGYDPFASYVAASGNIERSALIALMSTVGYDGNEINILDFGFTTSTSPDEKWMAIFVPPSFDGWQALATDAGLAPTTQSLCAPSGTLAG